MALCPLYCAVITSRPCAAPGGVRAIMPDSAVLVFLVISGAVGSAALVAAFFIGAGYLTELRLPRAVRQERAARRSAPGRGDDPLALALEAVRQGTEDTC